MTMADFFVWTSENTWDGTFWFSPLGLFTLISILACSVHHLICPSVDDDIIDRLYYWACAMTCAATLYHVQEGQPPVNVVKTMMVAMAVRFIADVVQHHYQRVWLRKRRRPHP